MKKNIISYTPWSPSNLHKAISGYNKREMPILYLELSAKCTKCDCLYCDSPEHDDIQDELSFDEMKFIINNLAKRGLQWLYICGLGEPSEDEKFLPLISYLKEKNIKVTLFTNGLGFSKYDIQFLKESNVHLILKLDTFHEDIFDQLLGRKGMAKKIYYFLGSLINEGFVKISSKNETNLAFSIVPTALNIDSIPEVIKYCVNHSIYPAIGEMESLGNAQENLSILKVSSKDLHNLLKRISKILGYTYSRPLCPGIIADFRIDHIGNCIIDSSTGLGCGWFLNEKCNPSIIGNIRTDYINELQKKAFNYRCKQYDEAVNILKNKKPVISCGGGARPSEWIELYRSLMNESAMKLSL